MLNDLTIVVFCHKMDFFLTRICVASIRYFYPSIKILLVKDELNGNFSTKEIERRFDVKIYDCERKKFGWAASKTFFLLQAKEGEKYLLLDSDIVFVKDFLENVYSRYKDADIIVSPEYQTDITSAWIKHIYFDVSKVLNFDDSYYYPGYFFNTGQIFILGGVIKYQHLEAVFDKEKFPFWKRLDIFPLVDQSAYNYIFPKLHQENKLRLIADKFMSWSESDEVKTIKISEIILAKSEIGVIHWAGALRTPFIKKMTRADILIFFQNEYYKNIFLGSLKIKSRPIGYLIYSHYLRIKNKLIVIFNGRVKREDKNYK